MYHLFSQIHIILEKTKGENENCWREHSTHTYQTLHGIFFSNVHAKRTQAGWQASKASTNETRMATKPLTCQRRQIFVESTSDDRVSFYVHLNRTYFKEITDLFPSFVCCSPFFQLPIFSFLGRLMRHSAHSACVVYSLCVRPFCIWAPVLFKLFSFYPVAWSIDIYIHNKLVCVCEHVFSSFIRIASLLFPCILIFDTMY